MTVCIGRVGEIAVVDQQALDLHVGGVEGFPHSDR